MEFNRFVAYWQAKNNLNNHEKKLKSIQSVVRTTKNFSPVKQRNKSLNNYYTNRSFEIELENRALLTKLIQQKHRKDSKSIEKMGRHYTKHRKGEYFKEYDKQNQNRELLKKLKNVKTTYKLQTFMQDYKQKQKYLNLICKYPVRGLKPTKTMLKLTNKAKRKSESQIQSSMAKTSQNEQKLGRKGRVKTTKQGEQSNKQNPISRIFRVQKIQIDEHEVVVKGIQYEQYIVLQLLLNGQQIKNSWIYSAIITNDFANLSNMINIHINSICDLLTYYTQYHMFKEKLVCMN